MQNDSIGQYFCQFPHLVQWWQQPLIFKTRLSFFSRCTTTLLDERTTIPCIPLTTTLGQVFVSFSDLSTISFTAAPLSLPFTGVQEQERRSDCNCVTFVSFVVWYFSTKLLACNWQICCRCESTAIAN